MQNSIDIGWLDVGTREDSTFAIQDNGRLRRVVSELCDQDNQYPSLCVFLGGKTKNHALQHLYPLNNIKRHESKAPIKLRYDVASLQSRRPVLLADGDIPNTDKLYPTVALGAGVGHPVPWNNYSAAKILQVLWSQLIFVFTDVVCIFIDDAACLEKVVHFLVSCLQLPPTSSFPSRHLPRAIFIYGPSKAGGIPNTELLYRRIQECGYNDLSGLFSSSISLSLQDDNFSDITRSQRIKASITEQVDAISSFRQENQARPNGTHLIALFQSALQHTLNGVSHPFDFVKATRKDRPVSLCAEPHLAHYLEIGHRANLPLSGLAATISSALFMDHYVPQMLATNPRMVFGTLYRSIVTTAYHSSKALWPDLCPAKETDLIEFHFSRLYKRFSENAVSSANLRKEQLKSFSGQLCRMRSSRICLVCLLRSAQHVLACGHTVCDRCAQIFGSPISGLEYQFTIKGCLYCLYQRPLVVDVLPPTMSPAILAIDGGGVRGVIPLEYLLLVQEHLRPCTIQDVVDLAIGTSSGGLIALGLFAMTWDVADCSERFNTLARRIFRERRPSTLPLLLRQMLGFISVFGDMAKWIRWLLYDSCYDSQVFDTALKSAFGERRRIFGASREDPRGPRRSGPKVGVVTTSISRDTSAFSKSYRRGSVGIGSFQDGGLKYNFAGEIANQVSLQIWPTAMGSTRMLSLGTGKAQSNEQTPHFRHVFRDSFVRRGFDAWMSTMETDSDWKKWRGRLNDSVKSDTHRLDVSLGKAPHTIDAVEAMEDYRDLVILQVGSGRMARDAATTLLVSRFFFVVDSLPEDTATAFWCRGSVRCKGPARMVILALENLYPDGLSYVSDCGLIDKFGGLDSLCPSCGCYNRSISLLARHLEYTVNIYIQTSSKKRWRIGGFPECVASFVSRQGLWSSFGQDNHGYPCRQPCQSCDVTPSPVRGRRRKRKSGGSEDVYPRKRVLV
ncbi:hypothetical protein N7505_010997 [Penicillium chrysogenum]|uniref:PNPLA domain-containing protein n=1 Tax=Penicillium chrysogenum TaxID=5076 RepID=A0ABQ8W5G4_PENCH|nr:hypothetical protein N7505_010997 [Penicillium chrysogenum]